MDKYFDIACKLAIKRGQISEEDKPFDELLFSLSIAKQEVYGFFDNVQVNDDSEIIIKNRLELINFFCKTCENFINFQLIKDIND